MIKTLVILASIQGNLNLVDRWAIFDQYIGDACTTVQIERFIITYPYDLQMTYIKR